jgi:hypothetical protein
MLVEVVAPADHESLVMEAVRLARKPVPTEFGRLEPFAEALALRGALRDDGAPEKPHE